MASSTDTDVRLHTREFLGRFVRVDGLGDDDDIFAVGFVNSLFAMELVTFVEATFSVTVHRDDLDLDNFRTINAIAAFVERKNAVRG